MSFIATEWAYGIRGITGPEKAVLVCLAWHHNQKTGLCCPSPALIAAETCLGLSTAKKALASLEAKGLLARTPWKRGSAYMLAIVQAPTEKTKAPTEPPISKQESNKKTSGGFQRDWKDRRPKPPETPREALEKAQAKARRDREQTFALTADDGKTPEERAAIAARALALFRAPKEAPCAHERV